MVVVVVVGVVVGGGWESAVVGYDGLWWVVLMVLGVGGCRWLWGK